MIDMVQKYMRVDATRKETYIELGAVVYKYKHCKKNFALSKLTMEAIRPMHADFYDLPDDTRHNVSANVLNKIKILEEEVTIDDSEQSLQTISPILNSEGTDTQCINQKAQLMFEQNQLSPDWVAGLEGETVICEDVSNVTIRLSTSHSHIGRLSRIQTRISHVHPTAIIHQRDTLLRLCYCGVLRAGISDLASAYVPVYFYTCIHIQTVILVCIFTSKCTYITDDIKLLICHMHISYCIQTNMILIQTYMIPVI
jgi:hypothetical protein